MDEAKRLVSVYANSEKENEIRDNAILHLFLNCGLRLSELKTLNIAEQVQSKSNNIDNLPSLGKILAKDFGSKDSNNELKVI